MADPKRFTPDEVAARIRAARAYSAMSRKELATALGVSPSTVERWERGEEGSLGSAEKRYSLLWNVAKATQVHAPWLLDNWSGEPVTDVDQLSRELKQRLETATAQLRERMAHDVQSLRNEIAHLQEKEASLAEEGLEEDLEEAAQRSETTSPRTEGRERASANE